MERKNSAERHAAGFSPLLFGQKTMAMFSLPRCTVLLLVLLWTTCLPEHAAARPHSRSRSNHALVAGATAPAQPHIHTALSTDAHHLTWFANVTKGLIVRHQTSRQNSVVPVFNSAVRVSNLNLLLFCFVPDPGRRWVGRLPRLAWETTIRTILEMALHCREVSWYRLLSLVLGWAALGNLGVASPLYAYYAATGACLGGDAQDALCKDDALEGWGHAILSIAFMISGLVYLSAALEAWRASLGRKNARTASRRVQIVD